MRSFFDRLKPSELELPGIEPLANADSAEADRPVADQPLEVRPREVPVSPAPSTGAPLLVPWTALYEDPDNPRTEFPEAELRELADDIGQHGILQPIVVHAADEAGRFRIQFGAKRYRAAALAGLVEVPVTVRQAAVTDPYTQVAENQKRHGLSPLDLARFIRSRVDLGESNATIAKRLGMDLTTVAHHLALLTLPEPLDEAARSGRCAAPRTLYELGKAFAERPEAVAELLQSDKPITREAVAALRQPVRRKKAVKRTSSRANAPARPPKADQLATRAERLCTQLAATCSQLRGAGFDHVPVERLALLRERLGGLKVLLEP